MMNVLLEMANSLYPYLQFTGELPEDNVNGKCPMLDLQVWKTRTSDGTRDQGYREEIHHEFYQKACSSTLVIMKESAMPERSKIVTLSQEVVRRMRNTGRAEPVESRAEILSDLMLKMKDSGYNISSRVNVLKSGLRGYYSMVLTEAYGGRPVNRPASMGQEERDRRWINRKSTWHRRRPGSSREQKVLASLGTGVGVGAGSGLGRSNGTSKPRPEGDMRTEAIVFVPCTKGGELRSRLQRKDDEFSRLHDIPRIRFVEKGGTKLKDSLSNSNPWSGQPCMRTDCWACSSTPAGEVPTNCHSEGVMYSIECKACSAAEVTTTYIGETSRSLYQRSREHRALLRGKNEDSVLWEHCVEVHGSMLQEFTVRVLQKHRTAFNRQINEAVLIRYCKSDIKLNRNDEWNCARIPDHGEFTGASNLLQLQRNKQWRELR